MMTPEETQEPTPESKILAPFFPEGQPDNPFAGLSPQFQPVAQQLMEEHRGKSAIELLILAQLIQAAYAMHLAACSKQAPDEACTQFDSDAPEDAPSGLRQAQRDFQTAHEHLMRAEAHNTRQGKLAPPPPEKPKEPEIPPRPFETHEQIQHGYDNWQDLIAIVSAHNEKWPVLLRTGLVVEDIMMLNHNQYFTDDEVLYLYPELWRSELAACQACQDAECCGPFDFLKPVKPESGLRTIDGPEGQTLAAYYQSLPRTKTPYFPLGKPETLAQEAAAYHVRQARLGLPS